jgi:hypothetical protein
MALEREVLEEIGCEVQVAHLIGVYAKPYRDDLVLSFAATLVGGTPRACSPEIADIGFFQGGDIPADIAFNSMVRVRDALDGCRGVVRVFATVRENLAATLRDALLIWGCLIPSVRNAVRHCENKRKTVSAKRAS